MKLSLYGTNLLFNGVIKIDLFKSAAFVGKCLFVVGKRENVQESINEFRSLSTEDVTLFCFVLVAARARQFFLERLQLPFKAFDARCFESVSAC